MIQLQSATAEHRDVRRRYAAYLSPLVKPTCRLRVPRRLLWSGASFPLVEALAALGEIWTQDSRSHIAMSYEPSIAWKASLRAHRRRFARPLKVLKPRWSGRTAERRERVNNYTMLQF